jgi:tripartite-type tricarboxylate transporter receptor subunit TctC
MNTTVGASLALFIVAGSVGTSGSAAAQSYPSRPIRVLVPSAAGGSADIAVRSLANELGKQIGQTVVAENRPGASSIISFETLARAAPDGYTLGYVASNFVTNPSLFAKLPYDSARDFQAVVLASSAPSLLAVTPSLPVRSVKDLIELARAKPGTLSYGSAGVGAALHLSMELLKSMTKTNIVHVAYKGQQQALTDVISGQIQVVCDQISSILPHVKSGRVRPLGVTALTRLPVVPDVPTLNEAYVTGYEFAAWGGYVTPAQVPRDIVLRLNTEINKVLSLPSFSKAMTERGSTAIGGTPEQFAEHLKQETAKWAAVIKATGIKPQ